MQVSRAGGIQKDDGNQILAGEGDQLPHRDGGIIDFVKRESGRRPAFVIFDVPTPTIVIFSFPLFILRKCVKNLFSFSLQKVERQCIDGR